MSNSAIDSSDLTQRQIKSLIDTYCIKYGIECPSNPALIEQTRIVIRPLLEKMDPKLFYQWFCPIWQSFEYLYSLDESESAWPGLVGKFASALTERESDKIEFTHPNLRAMCVSFMMNSLNSHVIAQSYALRMLLLFATRTNLSQDTHFVHWLLQFMHRRIDNMIEIRDDKQRELFTTVCVGFFDSIPVFDSLCSLSILKFLGSPEFTQILASREEQVVHLQSIATKTFNTTLADDSFFIFEIIRNTKLVYDNLTAEQKELLEIFVAGDVNDFDGFVPKHQEYFSANNLSIEALKYKIHVLTFVSIVNGKDSIKFEDIQKGLNLDEKGMKKLCVKINSTDVAKTSIDSINQQVIIEFCQPRLMNDKEWDAMASKLTGLGKSLAESK